MLQLDGYRLVCVGRGVSLAVAKDLFQEGCVSFPDSLGLLQKESQVRQGLVLVNIVVLATILEGDLMLYQQAGIFIMPYNRSRVSSYKGLSVSHSSAQFLRTSRCSSRTIFMDNRSHSLLRYYSVPRR